MLRSDGGAERRLLSTTVDPAITYPVGIVAVDYLMHGTTFLMLIEQSALGFMLYFKQLQLK